MSLSQSDRIAISKKIIAIPQLNASADTTIAQIEIEKAKAQLEDNANKTLLDDVNVYVHGYQAERERYDSNGHNQLLEQDLVDSANRKLQNFFFPNDPQTPLPSIPDGIWKNFVVFSGSKGLGKNYNETYILVPGEQAMIADINAKILVVESFSAITRSTGQSCTPVDIIANDPAMQAAGADLISAILAWETLISGTYSIIMTTDADPTRSAQNIAAKADINITLPIINTWQALATYDTGHGEVTCAGFNSHNVNLLNPTKFRAAELLPIKNELTRRLAFVSTRMTQLNTNLGIVVQNMSTGVFTTTTGFFGQRIRIIDVRLNAMGGSLSKLKGLERGQAAQVEAKNANDNAALVYTTVVRATAFRAPATGAATIHVLDASGFSISDVVYITAENQAEITTSIVDIQGNAVFLADQIPQRYRQNEFARLYKVL